MGEFALDGSGHSGLGFEIWPSLLEINLKNPLQTSMTLSRAGQYRGGD